MFQLHITVEWQSPSFAPIRPPRPMRDFHEVKETSGVLQMTGEPPSHVPMMKQTAWISQVPSLPQILCWRESSAKMRWLRREYCFGCGACMPCCCTMETNVWIKSWFLTQFLYNQSLQSQREKGESCTYRKYFAPWNRHSKGLKMCTLSKRFHAVRFAPLAFCKKKTDLHLALQK